MAATKLHTAICSGQALATGSADMPSFKIDLSAAYRAPLDSGTWLSRAPSRMSGPMLTFRS